jgi:hypothetical protein
MSGVVRPNSYSDRRQQNDKTTDRLLEKETHMLRQDIWKGVYKDKHVFSSTSTHISIMKVPNQALALYKY